MKSSTHKGAFCRNIFSKLAGPGLCCVLIGYAGMWIEWISRIGVCNSDQAVIGLGPPDKSAKLTDGTVVAERMMRRGCSGGLVRTSYGCDSPYCYYKPPSPGLLRAPHVRARWQTASPRARGSLT
ncbi:MAG TPA: hypothetical protein VN887_07110 [Candidatus Angelobacter sp.]|nr:hypothetical protein [Candidatus Angelobacter sp.]